jgi:hypothetical protein
MVAIILACDEATKSEAFKAGFKEQTVLVKHEPCASTPENKSRVTIETKKLRPFQFLVSDFWGITND